MMLPPQPWCHFPSKVTPMLTTQGYECATASLPPTIRMESEDATLWNLEVPQCTVDLPENVKEQLMKTLMNYKIGKTRNITILREPHGSQSHPQ